MHRQRLLVAAVGLPLLFVVLLWAPAWVFGLVVTAAAAGVQLEFYRLHAGRLTAAEQAFGAALGVLVGLGALSGDPATVLAALVGGVLALFLQALARPEAAGSAAERVGLLVFGLAYGPVLLGHATLARTLPGELGPGAVAMALGAVFGGDTAAYYAGKAWGRRKLYPSVSPGKTWEGAAAGVLGTLLGVAVFRAWLVPDLAWGHVVALGLVAALVGQLGDLCESLLKRGVGVKDSGGLLPGHGGLLDRLDSLLFVAPVVYYYVRIVETLP
jgi:phosphatidate cytidylyltransferase